MRASKKYFYMFVVLWNQKNQLWSDFLILPLDGGSWYFQVRKELSRLDKIEDNKKNIFSCIWLIIVQQVKYVLNYEKNKNHFLNVI